MSSFEGTTTANRPGSKTEQAKEQAKEKAQEGAQQARRGVRDQVDQRSTQAGERVGSTAQDIRSVSEELRKQGKDQPAKLAEQAASRAESLGDYLQRSDGDTILRDVEDFGRQRPWAVIAGGLALGFAASRFLKASSSRRYESSSSQYTPTRSLTAGAPTSRTGLAADDVSPEYGRPSAPLADVPPAPLADVPPAPLPSNGDPARPGTGAFSDDVPRGR